MKTAIACILLYLVSSGPVLAENNGGTVRPGEYQLVFSQPLNKNLIKKTFSEYGVIYVLPLSPNSYLMRLKSDPGKNKIEFIAKSLPNLKSIYVNSAYRVK